MRANGSVTTPRGVEVGASPRAMPKPITRQGHHRPPALEKWASMEVVAAPHRPIRPPGASKPTQRGSYPRGRLAHAGAEYPQICEPSVLPFGDAMLPETVRARKTCAFTTASMPDLFGQGRRQLALHDSLWCRDTMAAPPDQPAPVPAGFPGFSDNRGLCIRSHGGKHAPGRGTRHS
jgi:hypothetical protein